MIYLGKILMAVQIEQLKEKRIMFVKKSQVKLEKLIVELKQYPVRENG